MGRDSFCFFYLRRVIQGDVIEGSLAAWATGRDFVGALDHFSQGALLAFAGLLVVSALLDFFGQAFFFAKLLEAAEHLLGGFTVAGLDPDGHGDCLSSGRGWGLRGFEPGIVPSGGPGCKSRGVGLSCLGFWGPLTAVIGGLARC